MFLRMIYDEKLAQAAYLIGCQRTGEAIVFDPQRDVDRYLELAHEHDLRIVAAAETHIHADFLSGVRELSEIHGVTAYVSGEGGDEWSSKWIDVHNSDPKHPSKVLQHNDSFMIGHIQFTVIHTPGHTPEHLCFLVTDQGSGADEPAGLISGDFVFVGDLGRPDLLESAAGVQGAMEPSARALYQSVSILRELPDFTQIWPGHGSGSACGKALGAVPSSTVGYECRFNQTIKQASSEQGFVDFILQGQPEPPLYFARMKELNRDGPPILRTIPDPPKLEAARLADLNPHSCAIIDMRPWDQFREAHIPGSLSFPMSRSFNTDAGSMIGPDEPIYLIIDEEHLDTAIRDLVRIGLDRIEGWSPAHALSELDRTRWSEIKECTAAQARSMLERSDAPSVLDVRRASEYSEGHIGSSINIAHTRLASRTQELDKDAPILVHCRSGIRSARASAYLQRAGFQVTNLQGGYLAWVEANNATIKH